MKKFFDGVAGLIVLALVLAVCLGVGVLVNGLSQIGICHFEGGSGYLNAIDLMGGIVVYDQPPTQPNGEMIALGGGLFAGLILLGMWLLVACAREGNKKSLFKRKIEFSLFSVGIAQIIYGFSRLAFMLFGWSLITPFAVSILALGLAIIFGVLLYRKQLPDLFKVMILKQERAYKATDRVICKNCNKVIPKKYRYCGYCGTPKAKANIIVCDNCRGLALRSHNYCSACGTAIK